MGSLAYGSYFYAQALFAGPRAIPCAPAQLDAIEIAAGGAVDHLSALVDDVWLRTLLPYCTFRDVCGLAATCRFWRRSVGRDLVWSLLDLRDRCVLVNQDCFFSFL